MKIVDFAITLGKLKKTKRTGWIREEVPNPESIAEHSFRVATLTMIFASKVGASIEKSIKMALVHDIGEAEIGDVVTSRGNKTLPNHQDKIKRERNSLKKILSLVDNKEYLALFDEYEANATTEARLVKQIDKLEMAIQAYEYEKEHKIILQEFFDDATSKIKDDQLKNILDNIISMRQK